VFHILFLTAKKTKYFLRANEMGMRQRRCPKCKKKRPYNEVATYNDKRIRESKWFYVDGQLICYRCYDKTKNSKA